MCEETWECDKCLSLSPDMYRALQSLQDLTFIIICPPCKMCRCTCDKHVSQAEKAVLDDFTKQQELKFDRKHMKAIEKRALDLEYRFI